MYHMQYLHPDIAQAVRDLAKHMTQGNETHMAAMLRCMQYLMYTKNAGLLLKPTRKWDGTNKFQFKIRGRSDLDYAIDMQTRQSVSGYVVYYEETPVMHRSATQKTVALLSCEAELNAAVLCVQDMLYTKNLLKSIGLKVELTMMMEINNKGAVDVFNSFTVGGCTCQNRTEHLRKLGNFTDYYLDKFNQIGVFICHKHIVVKQHCSRNRGERALPFKLISCLGIVQLPRSGVEHMP
jgi:hypothetical protein